MNRGQVPGAQRRGERSDDVQHETYKRCVLIVEDDERVRELIAMLMQSEGFEAVELGDGMEALNYLAASHVYHRDVRRPDLVIADIHMPSFSGLDLLMGMRESRVRPPVMLVTGVKDEEMHREARRLGAAQVVTKPFDVDYFLRAVDECLASPSVEAVVEPEIVTQAIDA